MALLLLAASLSLCAFPAHDNRAVGVQLPSGLDPLVPSYPSEVELALKSLKKGVDDYGKGQFSTALQDLPDEAATASIAIGDYVLYYRAKSNLALEQGAEALRLLHLLQSRYPASPLMPEAILAECQAQLKLRQPAAALAVLQDRKAEENADSLYIRAQALEQAGKTAEASALYLRVYAKYATSKAAAQAEQRLRALSPAYQSSPKNLPEMLERAENLIRAGKSRDARALLLKLAQVKPPAGLPAAKRRILWAQAEFNLGRSTTLVPSLEKIGPSAPAIHAQSIYLLGLCYRRMKQEESFLAMRDRALDFYPQSAFTEKLLFSAAAYFDIANRQEEAGEAYALVAARFPKGEYVERALWRSALFLYFQKKHDEALRAFWRFQNAYPGLRPSIATLFWMGRCYEKLGDGAKAIQLYRRCRFLASDSYYGLRAQEGEEALRTSRIKPDRPSSALDFVQVQTWADGLRVFQAPIAGPQKPVEAILARARQLTAADLPDSALGELRAALRRYPNDRAILFVMSRIYELKQDFFGVIRTLRRAFPDYDANPVSSLPAEVWDLLFPMRYQNMIDSEAAKHRVDPNLVRAIIRQESAFEEDARSSANARGLMQVLPSTGRLLARGAGINRFTAQKLYRADINIALGTRFLAGLLRDYDQRVEVALAAYNAGTDRAERWQREYGTTDTAEFVDRIPFTETRDYVKQVLTNAAYYRLLAASSQAGSR